MRRIGQLLIVLACAFAVATPVVLDAQAGPPGVSPEVGADRRVTLRYFAPNAKSVVAAGELDGKPHPLTRDENGIWSVTIGPLAPDIYTYAFNVDGVTALDPLNANTKYGYGRFGAVSVVQVPGDGPQFYDVKPVPHGEVRIRPYISKTLGVSRTVWVYTPPGYDTRQQLSRAVSPARRRRHRIGLDDDRPGEQHPRQRDCRGQGEADGRRDAARARDSELLDRPREAGARSGGEGDGRRDTRGDHQRDDGRRRQRRPLAGHQGHRRGRDADDREHLQGVEAPRRSRDRRPVDGRRPHASTSRSSGRSCSATSR